MKKVLYGLLLGLFGFVAFSTNGFAEESNTLGEFPLATQVEINQLPEKDQELLADATPENPVFIYEWKLETDSNSLLRAAAPHLSGLIYARHVGSGVVATTFTGNASNCIVYNVSYRMWHGDGNFHDKTVNAINSSSFQIPDQFISRVTVGSITIRTTGQISTSLGGGTIVAAPKAVWMG
ncbi:hypothetical protein [Enterococcus faecalis]|uniref:hypothetical protein n=1 Tax=Enterococcus faecalis TaxID=1351 RepID=UPI002DBE3182|nr:hypothetical protein [Enterococcus faecalis]MEB7954693.1 hypothetical protein [Enterococcus faecalis]MEB7964852.1 hypothetical protein [Enterococcus faecalis]